MKFFTTSLSGQGSVREILEKTMYPSTNGLLGIDFERSLSSCW